MNIRLNTSLLLFYLAITLSAVNFAACNPHEKSTGIVKTQRSDPPDNINLSNEEQGKSDIDLLDEAGQALTLKSLRGKVIFINFWATWCPPCLAEMPSINRLKQTFKNDKNMVFLMVDVDNNIEKSRAFMAKHNYDLQVYTPQSRIPSEFLGEAIPTTVIIDKDGNMVVRLEGGRDFTNPDIIHALRDLIDKKQ